MARNIIQTAEPVTLDGYQAVLKPSKFGYSLSAIIDSGLVDKLEKDRTDSLKWAESKLKNPKRSTLKPEPWEEVARISIKLSSPGMRTLSHLWSIQKAHTLLMRTCLSIQVHK